MTLDAEGRELLTKALELLPQGFRSAHFDEQAETVRLCERIRLALSRSVESPKEPEHKPKGRCVAHARRHDLTPCEFAESGQAGEFSESVAAGGSPPPVADASPASPPASQREELELIAAEISWRMLGAHPIKWTDLNEKAQRSFFNTQRARMILEILMSHFVRLGGDGEGLQDGPYDKAIALMLPMLPGEIRANIEAAFEIGLMCYIAESKAHP